MRLKMAVDITGFNSVEILNFIGVVIIKLTELINELRKDYCILEEDCMKYVLKNNNKRNCLMKLE